MCQQEWWTHLWLNEGFASWIEYLCVDHCFPEYDIWTQFVSADYTRALDLDALDSSHPIEVGCSFFFCGRCGLEFAWNLSSDSPHRFCCLLQVNVGHPSEVDEIFDAISYSKGASVIRMLHNYIGDEVGSLPFLFSCIFSRCFTSLFVFVGLQERNECISSKVPA